MTLPLPGHSNSRDLRDFANDGDFFPDYEADFARTMLNCPYYRDEGVCVTGCQSEPYCVTGQPKGGWESLLPPDDAPNEQAVQEKRVCGFCGGKPVGNAATWLDGQPRPPAACPRCGETHVDGDVS
jgi:hypothetical protein